MYITLKGTKCLNVPSITGFKCCQPDPYIIKSSTNLAATDDYCLDTLFYWGFQNFYLLTCIYSLIYKPFSYKTKQNFPLQTTELP